MDVDGSSSASSIKKWKIIYPVYLNSKKTVAEGRRIAATKACPDPTCIEIADSCTYLKIRCAIELDKAYPRDFFQVGRLSLILYNMSRLIIPCLCKYVSEHVLCMSSL
uniref:Uncharacterized protein n=1 Tax=Avena sativa TaxID=4498 RepID=A0ACD5ZMT7_AVESA